MRQIKKNKTRNPPLHQFTVNLLFFTAALTGGTSIIDTSPLHTPQFATNITHRTNLCNRQLLLRTGALEFSDILRGLNLSVALVYTPENGYVNYNEETGDFDEENPGYWVKLLDELALRAGFSWRHSYGIVRPLFDDSNSLNPNATASDLLLWTVNTYDFTFGEWDGTVDRMKLGVDFPTGFSDTSTILIANKNIAGESSSFHPFAFLRPFDIPVWGAIVATIILTGITYRTIHKLYSVAKSRENNSTNHVHGVNIFYSAMAATGHVEFQPVTHGERILVFSLCFWSLIIVSTYTANLASDIISQQQRLYPASSLAEAERLGVPVCAVKGLSISTKLRDKYPKLKLVEADGLHVVYEYMKNGRCKIVAEGASRFDVVKRDEMINGDCTLEWIGRAEDISSGGPASIVDAGFYCTSLVGHAIEYFMKQMIYDGFVEITHQQFLNSESSHSCPNVNDSSGDDVEDSSMLTLIDMGGIFLTHGICCVVALLVSWFQRWMKRRDKNYDCSIDSETPASCFDDDGSGGIVSSRIIVSGGY